MFLLSRRNSVEDIFHVLNILLGYYSSKSPTLAGKNRTAKKEFVTKFFFANTIYETTLANAFKFTFDFLQMFLTFLLKANL